MPRRAAILFCLLCAAWYIYSTAWGDLDYPSDFIPYHQAAQNVLAGRTPYVTSGYIYPPLLAYLLTPLAPLSYLAARWVWYVFSQICLLAAAGLMWRSAGSDWATGCSIAFVWAVGGAAVESLTLGQLGPLLVLLLAVAYTQRGWRPAAAAGFGLALKFIPGVLAVVLLLRRDWRGLLIFASVAAGLLAIPWYFTACCLNGPKTPAGTDTWTGTPAILSWSLPSVALRAMDPPRRGGPPPAAWEFGNDLPNLRLPASRRGISIAVAALTLLAGIALLAVASKGRVSPAQAPFFMAALISLSLAASPVCWTHYQILQYPGMALLIGHLLRSRQWKLLACALAVGALLYPAPVEILRFLAVKDGSWKLIPPATLFIWTSAAPVAALALFGLLTGVARQLAPFPIKRRCL